MAVTAAQLRQAARTLHTTETRAAQARAARDKLIRQALAEGWEQATVAREVGVKRSMIGHLHTGRRG